MTNTSARPDRLNGFADVATPRNTLNNTRIDLRLAHPGLEARCPGRSVQCPVLVDLMDINSGMMSTESFIAVVAAEVAKADTGGAGPVRYDPATVNAALVDAGVGPPPLPVTLDPTTADMPPPLTSGYVDDPINAATGNMIHVDKDLDFPVIAAALTIERTWNSRAAATPGAFGDGWSSVFDLRLDVDAEAERVVAHLADGSTVAYVKVDGEWDAAGVPQIRLLQLDVGTDADSGSGARWAIQRDQLRRFFFDAAGQVTGWHVGVARVEVRRGDGGRIIGLHERVSGRSLTVDWSGRTISGLSSDDGRQVVYERDEYGVMQRVVGFAGGVEYVWDGELLESVVDGDGVRLFVNVYDDEHRVIEQTSPFGRVSTYHYDSNGVTTFSDAAGVVQGMRHDHLGNLTAMFDVDGSALHLSYDDQRRIVRATERDGTTIRYRYDGDDLVERIDPDGLTQTWEWDDRHRLVAETDRAGATTRFEYDTDHQAPSRVITADGAVNSQTLDERGLPLEIVDPDGVVTRFRWDRDGQVLATIDAFDAETTFDYDGHGHLARIAPPSGSPTVMHSEGGRVVRTERGDAVWEYRYTPAGRVCGGVEPGNIGWSATFGEHGALTTFSDATGATATFDYDQIGNITTTTAPDGAQYQNVYDEVGRHVAAIDPTGATSTKRYDRVGRLVELTEPRGGVWKRRLDEFGRTTSSIAPDGAETFWKYRPTGEVETVIAPGNRAWRTEYDVVGRPIVQIDPVGRRSTIAYTAGGRVASRTAPSGRTESYEYDAAGRLVALVGFDGVRRRFELDRRGRIAAIDRYLPTSDDAAERRRIEYRWDDEYRMTGITIDDGVESTTSTMVRDAGGRLVSAADPTGVASSYAWDERGLLTSATDPAGGITNYDYDRRGRLSSMVTPGGGRSSFGYDGAGRTDSMVDPAGVLSRLKRDANGDITGARNADGVGWDRQLDPMGRELARVGTDGSVAGDYRYDAAGRLSTASAPGSGVTIEFFWDDSDRLDAVEGPDGRRVIERDADGMTVASRDADDSRTALSRDTVDGHRFRRANADVEGDGASVSTARDRGGRLTIGTDGTMYRYDEVGRIAEIVPADGDATSYTYSASGLLVTEHGPAGRRQFRYDVAGRVVARDDEGGTTEFDYDNSGRRWRERRGDGHSVVYRWDVFDRLVTIERYDGLDHLVGDVAITYDALGRPAFVDGEVVGYEPATGLADRVGDRQVSADVADHRGVQNPLGGVPVGDLWVIGLRALDPATHQFLSSDAWLPAPGSNGAASGYTYAWNDPINWADPSGMRPLSIEEFGAKMDAAEQSKLGAAWEAIKEDPWGSLAMVGVAAVGVGLLFVPGGQAIGAGILIGVGTSAVMGIATGTFNPRSVAISGAFGAIPGGSTVRGAVMMGMTTGAGETIVQSYATGQGFPSPQELAFGTVTSGVMNGGGAYVARRLPFPNGGSADELTPPSSTAAADHSPTGTPGRPELPDYDGVSTEGVLVTNEGRVYPLSSGGDTPHPNYPNSRHVEGHAATTIRETGSTGGTVYHNNPGGTCGFCHTMTSRLLPEGATLDVEPPPGAVAANSRAHPEPTSYTGDAQEPKPPK